MGYKGTEPYEGLATLHWAAVSQEGSGQREDPARLRGAVERYGQPALEVGCGTGRLLLELRQQGYAVDGCDLSLEMLYLCAEAARQRGLGVDLYWQAMQDLHRPRRYRSILVPCGSFMHLVARAEALEALRRFHAHLLPEGALLLELYLGHGFPLPRVLPAEWKLVRKLRPESEGSSLLVEKRAYAADPLEQIFTDQRRYTLLRQERVVREEVRPARYRWYGKVEVSVMLAWAGFQEIDVRLHRPSPSDSHELDQGPRMMVTARREVVTEAKIEESLP